MEYTKKKQYTKARQQVVLPQTLRKLELAGLIGQKKTYPSENIQTSQDWQMQRAFPRPSQQGCCPA